MGNMRVSALWLLITAMVLVVGCPGKEGTAMEEKEGLQPIDIRSPDFFWLVQPWKEGKLATIDGWGRFAEISFVGANKIQIKPFSNYPRAQMDRTLMTWPEAGLIASTTGKMHHLAAVGDNKTKSHVPLLSWVHIQRDPVLIDPREGLIAYSYALDADRDDIDVSLFVYNYKTDTMVYESPEEGFTIVMLVAMDNQYALSYQGSFDGEKRDFKKIFYNWKTKKVVENDLTKAINENEMALIVEPLRNIHTGRRYLFEYSDALEKRVMITWDEGYSDVKVTPLDYLAPKGKRFDDFIFTADGSWATTLVRGYQGLYNETLCKRAFFHLDERYPNKISMAIITDDYESSQWDYSAFVEHPVHGLCFAQEWHKNDQLYLRLYRMSDVLDEINKQLLENAKEVVVK